MVTVFQQKTLRRLICLAGNSYITTSWRGVHERPSSTPAAGENCRQPSSCRRPAREFRGPMLFEATKKASAPLTQCQKIPKQTRRFPLLPQPLKRLSLRSWKSVQPRTPTVTRVLRRYSPTKPRSLSSLGDWFHSAHTFPILVPYSLLRHTKFNPSNQVRTQKRPLPAPADARPVCISLCCLG